VLALGAGCEHYGKNRSTRRDLAIVLRTTNPTRTLWEAILPPGFEDLPAELARVDAVLDDPVFFEPYRRLFSARMGRPSTPIETYLRLMFLKHRYRLGYETLCREVADSISWSRFCRIPLGAAVPHPSTLGKLTARAGEEVIDELNRALLAKAVGEKVIKTNQVRADTTVVAANVSYPTDSGLLVRAIKLIVGLVGAIHSAGGASRTKLRDRRRAAGRRARSISAHLKLRNDDAKAAVLTITGELADMAEASIAEATRVLLNARRSVARQGDEASGRLKSSVAELEVILGRAGRAVAQTRARLAGNMPASASRLVSMHDPDARPIAKGRLGKPVEFGYKAQVVDNSDGIVLDHSVHQGNPADAPLLEPAIARIKKLCGRAPRALTADRGYGEAKIDEALGDLGVKTVVIPRKGKPSTERRATEHRRGFVRLVKWRTGSEGRISYLKRRFGWDRTLYNGLGGATTWCGLGVLAHNAVKIAALIDDKHATRACRATPVHYDTATIDTEPAAPDPPPGAPPPEPTGA